MSAGLNVLFDVIPDVCQFADCEPCPQVVAALLLRQASERFELLHLPETHGHSCLQ